MARYYFCLENGHPIGDPFGEDLPDEMSALAAARKIAVYLGRNKGIPGHLRIVVRDHESRRVGEVSLMTAQ